MIQGLAERLGDTFRVLPSAKQGTLTSEEWWGDETIQVRSLGSHLSCKGEWFLTIPMESLILAQDKRWRRA
jgi:hypothetical protein